jgi:6-phosphogluconate dehydrogenase
MTEMKAQIGMVGLGVMGRNFLLNIAEHGFTVIGYDKDPQKVTLLQTEAGGLPIQWANNVADFVRSFQSPRSIILLVPAGPIVDNVIRDLLPYLEPGDLIIDAGNSHFTDTDIRTKTLVGRGLYFMGMGISGGEYGARHGPSLMPGGPEAAYSRVRLILEATAAQVNGEACVAYLGPRSAGHYVKMVHNGIEYGMMQLIAETYDLMHRGIGMTDNEIADVFDRWNQSELNGYLVEITADILRRVDEITGKPLIDVVLDSAKQLGTGMWTSQDGLELHVPTPTVDVAVAMRNLSAMQAVRSAIGEKYGAQFKKFTGERKNIVEKIRKALYAGIILTYAQEFSQLLQASVAYEYNLDLATIARIWRGGCIIRSQLLESIHSAYEHQPSLPHMLLDATLGKAVSERMTNLRSVVRTFAQLALPAPAFMASLAYFESLRAIHLPANLIQAQRDYFGSHTYERVDKRGVFHTEWQAEE